MSKDDRVTQMLADWTVELRYVDGDYEACIPELGRWACVAVGSTVEGALVSLVGVLDWIKNQCAVCGKTISKKTSRYEDGIFVCHKKCRPIPAVKR